MNSNPFPASFLNFKGQFHLARVYIPGNQTFMVSQAACSIYFMALPCAHCQRIQTCGHHSRPHTKLDMSARPCSR